MGDVEHFTSTAPTASTAPPASTASTASLEWDAAKVILNQRYASLNELSTDAKIGDLVDKMNASIKLYINRAGISPDTSDTTDPDYDTAMTAFNNLQSLQKNYIKLINDLTAQLASLTTNSDLKAKLTQIGLLKESIAKLNIALDNSKQDSYVSNSRQESVEMAKKDTSYYQGFGAKLGFSKPLHNISIPFLLGFGILLFFFSALLLKEFLIPPLKYAIQKIEPNEFLIDTFTDSRFLAALGGVVFTIVLVTILSLTGRLGKVI